MRCGCVLLLLILNLGCGTTLPPLTNDIKVSDRSTERQLIAGFHELERDSFRWTKHRFAVVLAVPTAAHMNGGILQVSLFLPDSQIERLGPVTLKANIETLELSSVTFAKSGVYRYKQVIPSAVLKGQVCSFVFTFDKSIRERGSEGRELSATVQEISLTASEPRLEHKHS
jgi:hypothetical protein